MASGSSTACATAPPIPAATAWRSRCSVLFHATARLRSSDTPPMTSSVTLVTGSSGFVGRIVMRQLAAAGHRAVGLDPVACPTTQVSDDLSDLTRLRTVLQREHVTHIIHAGGVSGPMVMADDPAGVITINVTGSINLLYAAIDC